MKPAAAALAVAALCALAVSQLAQANFADAAGFSGRGGFTCVACHTQPSPQAAQVTLRGLPEEGWTPGTIYPLRIEVEGGPPALPDPAPKGGFDLAASAGTFTVDDGILRLPSQNEVTYRPAGTMMRAWDVAWTAPALDAQPVPVRFWLAALAANGNHVVAANASDGGETLDAAASMMTTTEPSAQATSAWMALPLAPPTARLTGDAATGWLVEGAQTDGNATGIAWRLDGGAWTQRETGPAWRVALPADATVGQVDVRSEGAGRTSALVPFTLRAPPADADPSLAATDAPLREAHAPGAALAAIPLLTTLLAIAWRRTA